MSATPSPSLSPYIHAQNTFLYYFHSTPVIDEAFDFATLSIIAVILLLSLISLFCIFNLHHKSRSSLHLRSFNNRWTVRLLLVVFVSGWAVNEFLRLPFIRKPLSFSNQAQLCKLHVVLSLGFLEPCFLITLLYLINLSLNQKNPTKNWSVLLVIVISLLTFFLQIIVLYFTPLKEKLPVVMTRSSLISGDRFRNERMVCSYPFLSCILFCVFAIVYSMGLLLACWRVGSLVINRTIRVRINMLGVIVMVALLVQTLFLGAESLWTAEERGFGGVSLSMFVMVAVCAVVGEIILVIKPIMEALETVGRHYSRRSEPGLGLSITAGGGGWVSGKEVNT